MSGEGGSCGRALPEPGAVRLRLAAEAYRRGNHAEAERLARALEATYGPRPPILEVLGLALAARGAAEEAVLRLRAAVEHGTDSPALRFALGTALADLGAWEESAREFERAIALDPKFVDARLGLARALESSGRNRDSITCYKYILELFPDHEDALARCASLLEECNETEEAQALTERALRSNPRHVLARMVSAQLALRAGRAGEALGLLRELEGEDIGLRNAVVVAGRLVRALDALGRYDEAFAAAERAHRRLENLAPGADPRDPYGPPVLDGIAQDNGSLPPALPAGLVPRVRLAFLVGFPRSGTTLLDRMLARHPDVTVLEEDNPWVPLLRHLVEHRSRADWGTDDPRFEETARAIATRLSAAAPVRALLVDKLPLNSAYAGWLAALFPEARFVIAVRDPRDVCLSCFLQAFSPNTAMRQFWSLGTTVTYYDRVMGLLRRWSGSALAPERFCLVRYEDLVRRPGPVLASVCGVLGLGYRPEMADPRPASVGVRLGTPSYDQVACPIHGDAVGRWRRYEKHLLPYLPSLEPWVRYWGYDGPPREARPDSR